MPCEWLQGPNGAVIHINRGRSPGRLMKCKFCNYNYREADGKLCDFPVSEGKTCDAAMCSSCAVTLGGQRTELGKSGFTKADTVDVCPIHRTATYQNGKWK
jgi:hypothetical protein